MINYPMGSCVNFEKFSPCRVLDIFHLKNDWDMILDVGYNKSRVKGRFWVRHGDGEEGEKKKKGVEQR